MDIDPAIKSNLSFKERDELDKISKKLGELARNQPAEPPSAFELYK